MPRRRRTTGRRGRRERARRRLALRGLAAVAVLALGVVAWWLLAGSEPAREPEALTPNDVAALPAVGGAAPDAVLPPAVDANGSGVFTMEAPSDTRSPHDGALCEGCDVVLITLCSLRKDHVSAYGSKLAETPVLDRLASEGTRFSRAYAASNFTLAGLTAVLTARFGSHTGVTGWDKGLTADVPTLPEILGHYGYTTAAFTTDAPSGFRPDYGLDRGFQHMEIYPAGRDTPDGRRRGGAIGPGGSSARPVASWLAAHDADEPVFVMFHGRTAHFPFVLSNEGAEEDPTGITQLLWDAGQTEEAARTPSAMPGMAGGTAQEGVVGLVGSDPLQDQVLRVGQPAVDRWRYEYGRAVTWADRDLLVVWEALEARGRLDRTVVVVVADHGESLNDHGELLHGDAFFDGVINVPMIVRVPGFDGPEASDALVSHVDVMPTILELVGAVPPADADGVSLVPLLKGEVEGVRGTALSEGGVVRQVGPELSGAVISPPWVLLRQQRGCGPTSEPEPPRKHGELATCLFHLDDDPQQLRSQAAARPEVVADLKARWDGFRASHEAGAEQLELSPEFVQELRENGYDFRLGAP